MFKFAVQALCWIVIGSLIGQSIPVVSEMVFPILIIVSALLIIRKLIRSGTGIGKWFF